MNKWVTLTLPSAYVLFELWIRPIVFSGPLHAFTAKRSKTKRNNIVNISKLTILYAANTQRMDTDINTVNTNKHGFVYIMLIWIRVPSTC